MAPDPIAGGAGSPALRDRLLAALARLLTRAFYRSVETVGTPPGDGPVIIAASHLNGFVDPVLLVARLGLLPRFLAKSTLWHVAPARPFLAFARVIPVQRSQDTEGVVDNRRTFQRAVDALEERHLVAIFPEGTTHDDPVIRPLRTGVARIALQAAASGVEGLTIVPIGVFYEDKVAVRGRALVTFGEPIPVTHGPEVLDETGAPDPELVRSLTDQVSTAIRAITPDYRDQVDAVGLTAAARLALRPVPAASARPVPVAQVSELAWRLADAPAEDIDRVVNETARYEMLLNSVDLRDDDLMTPHGARALLRRSVVLAVLLVVLAPLAVAGLFANLVPALLVLLAGLTVKAPVSKGTVRLLVSLVAFPLTWGLLSAWDVDGAPLSHLVQAITAPLDGLLESVFSGRSGFWSGLVVFIAMPIFGAVTLVFVERIRALVRSLLVWRTLLDRRGQLAEVRAERARVVAVVTDVASGVS